MSLPGKLCIGILEEDNPLKSYFRFKPLLVEAGGRYLPYEGHEGYPEDGCIRIVPDKNESYHFKARMRRIGLFCVVDLREHPEDNDKIRPNKNYREGGAEPNANIIYSDVVREPAAEMIYEILPWQAPEQGRPRPHTPAVLMRGETLSPERWEWSAESEADGLVRLADTGASLPLEQLQVFDLPGFRGETVAFAIVPAAQMARVSDAGQPIEESRPERRVEKVEKAERPAAPQAESEPAPEEGASQKSRDDKPWIHHDSSMVPPPPDPRLTPAQRIMAAQAGMNPRRGRSLQELIDEKWQYSRLNQLGQPVAQVTTGVPLASPVDGAVRAVREVWDHPNLRRSLLESLSGIEEFGASLEECREVARQRDIERHLEGLEARRLALMGELDRLKAGKEEVRQQLKQEIRRDEAADLADALQRTANARADQERYEKLAEEARAAAQDARKAVDALTDEQLEQRLREFALNGHMLERMAQIRGEAKPVPESPDFGDADPDALAQRIIARYAAEGIALSRPEALNLIVCLALSPVLILTGPVGSGKTTAARLLADALGWRAAGRCVEFAAGRKPLAFDARIQALDCLPDAPALLVLDDANLWPACDPLRGLGGAMAERPQWRLCMTLQDSHCGYPVAANALDKGFAVRLSPKPDSPWGARAVSAAEPLPPVRLSGALAGRLPQPDSAVPETCVQRMEALRRELRESGAVPSRRALEEAWNYCGVMLACLGRDGDPAAVLDLAIAQRILPSLLASAPVGALCRLPDLLKDLPVSRALLDQPLPVMI